MDSVLLVNSDLAKNRGDRAIAEGLVALVRERFPRARITGLSEHAERDREWFGIDFLDMGSQSLNPLDYLRLLRAARQADLVLWGGGEILKDYTNKAALWYWCLKMLGVSLVNRNLYGAYQGIGPTSSPSSRRLIAAIVNRCRMFIVRDSESADKLVAWGARPDRVVASSDPAVLPTPVPLDDADVEALARQYGVPPATLTDFACLGPRDWFHYKPSGILPFAYRQRIDRLLGRPDEAESSADYLTYRRRLVALADELISAHDLSIVMIPMHMGEADARLCHYVAEHCVDPGRVVVVDRDDLSPQRLRALMARARVMLGFRLHSTIVAASSGVPSLNVYYVDKGRVFFEQIRQSQYSVPIERTLDDDFVEVASGLVDELLSHHRKVRLHVEAETTRLRELLRDSFTRVGDG